MKYSVSVLLSTLWLVLLVGCARTPPASSRQVTAPPPKPEWLVAVPDKAPPTSLIVPGQSIGPIRLGMNAAQVLALQQELGLLMETKNMEGRVEYCFKGLDIVLDDATALVIGLRAKSSTYTTKEGVGPGTTDLELRAKLGPPHKTMVFSAMGSVRDNVALGYEGLLFHEYMGVIKSVSIEPGPGTLPNPNVSPKP